MYVQSMYVHSYRRRNSKDTYTLFAEWVPKTELFRRNRALGEQAGVVDRRKEFLITL